MNTKLICYDLNATGQRYDRVIEYIKSLGDWAKPLRSQWFVKTNLSNSQIIDGLKAHGADDNDSLVVIDVTDDYAAWVGVRRDASDWMKTNI